MMTKEEKLKFLVVAGYGILLSINFLIIAKNMP
jgi:hypothetical protein